MSARTFTPSPGDQVYSIHGEAGRYVARSAAGHLVEPIFDDHDDEGPAYDEPRVWREVFQTPPTQRLHAQVAELEKQLTAARQALDKVRAEHHTFDAEERARRERITRHEQLADLDRYLAGELTHYVAIHDYHPDVEVIPVGKTIESYSNSNGYGILQLCPTRSWDKKVYWTVTYKVPDRFVYSRTKTVIPCCGEQEAYARAAQILRGYLDEYQAMEPAKRSYADMLVKSCEKFGVDVPQWLVDGIAAERRNRLERGIAEQRKKLADAEAELAQVTGSAA